MAVGAPGANGEHVLKRAALENNIAVGTATNQHQRMEENTVLVKIKSQGTAIQILAQVSMLRSVKTVSFRCISINQSIYLTCSVCLAKKLVYR